MAKKNIIVPKIGNAKNFTPYELRAAVRNLNAKDAERVLRKEYTRLRDIAQKRVKRLINAGLNPERSFRKLIDLIPVSADAETSISILTRAISEVGRFLRFKGSLLGGAREIRNKQIQTYRKHGYDVTAENYNAFGIFMRDLKSYMQGRFFDSERAVTLFERGYTAEEADGSLR